MQDNSSGDQKREILLSSRYEKGTPMSEKKIDELANRAETQVIARERMYIIRKTRTQEETLFRKCGTALRKIKTASIA